MNPQSSQGTFLNYRQGLRPVNIQQERAAINLRSHTPSSSDVSTHSAVSSPPTTPTAYSRIDTPTQITAIKSSSRQSGEDNLLIFTSSEVLPEMQQYLHTAIDLHNIQSISILGREEAVLKQTKMDAYTVAGKMQRNIQVQTIMLESVEDGESISRALNWLGEGNVTGVLFCVEKQSSDLHSPERDILDYDSLDLDRSWRSSILAVHSVARYTIPLMSDMDNTPFFLLDVDPASQRLPSINETTQTALLESIARSQIAAGVIIGYAKDHLLPPPPPSLPAKNEQRSQVAIPKNGYTNPTPKSPLGESPTKLWGLWAMQNEL